MNNFTKEELETIKKSIDDLMFSKFYAEDTQAVYKKIQSMIDNYCEHHESDGYDYFKIAEDELLMDVLKARKPELKCKICGKLYDDN